MIKIRELEKGVLSLPDKYFARFRAWFHKLEAERWDKQFEQDAASGKLEHLAVKARQDFAKGKCKEL
ncbi:MAG: hypothetical protein HZC18_06830 [Candidatus Omnitrophica bacterium]|nr:hypothetical protein [Candidatus Omnitrophota bacterium]